ncbi:UDP-Glycosyltransferase/glycogen phosphorylase [Delitschia confertaspora ATCC 74209]|uniref:UDP-Glycosyltransferase/glycogen phosphorylase n=1 Tax=Delitschia confertaspora ATCC 74209 TaxID=1513339 RepID=A0A9P4JNS1_9PLEO|nr:UDP-Glycosyltransferase/glycogen phosphorylase [Delitschia confertaspora ATCC 74209]
MRIAIVAPLYETVPPLQYGGTERVVYWLVEGLVRFGHDVTLYAAPGSRTSGQLIECGSEPFRERGLGDNSKEAEKEYVEQLTSAFGKWSGGDFDVVHVHHTVNEWHPTAVQRLIVSNGSGRVPVVWTDHNEIGKVHKAAHISALSNLGVGFVALSDSQRSTVPDANWLATIHHGLPANQYGLLETKSSSSLYLAFLGRIAPEKGIGPALRIAKAAGMKLKVAAKIDSEHEEFWEGEVKPLLEGRDVDFIGQISDQQKGPFLNGAYALLFPICWKEPFGLVMIEAMACGCPVIAYSAGSVPEVIEDGVTGFIVETEEEAVEALKKTKALDRSRIIKRFEERFTSKKMVSKYADVYQGIVEWAKKEYAKEKQAKKKDKQKNKSEVEGSAQRDAILQRISPMIQTDILPVAQVLSSLVVQQQSQHIPTPRDPPLATPQVNLLTTAPDHASLETE